MNVQYHVAAYFLIPQPGRSNDREKSILFSRLAFLSVSLPTIDKVSRL